MMVAHGLQQFLRNAFSILILYWKKKISKIRIKNIQLLLVELGFYLLSLIGIQFAHEKTKVSSIGNGNEARIVQRLGCSS